MHLPRSLSERGTSETKRAAPGAQRRPRRFVSVAALPRSTTGGAAAARAERGAAASVSYFVTVTLSGALTVVPAAFVNSTV